jgi:hypothetical protein
LLVFFPRKRKLALWSRAGKIAITAVFLFIGKAFIEKNATIHVFYTSFTLSLEKMQTFLNTMRVIKDLEGLDEDYRCWSRICRISYKCLFS